MGKGREPWGWRGTILGFAGHRVFVPTTELCHGRVKAATEYVSGWVWLCSTQKQGWVDSGHSWPTPGITGGLTWQGRGGGRREDPEADVGLDLRAESGTEGIMI